MIPAKIWILEAVPLKTQSFGDETGTDLVWIQNDRGAEFQNLESKKAIHSFSLGKHKQFFWQQEPMLRCTLWLFRS